jgi:hypothetical protein
MPIKFILILCIWIAPAYSAKEGISNFSDTLDVGYTYWWPGGGPFLGLCGSSYSMVFTAKVLEIQKTGPAFPPQSQDTLYVPQIGILKFNEIIYSEAPDPGPKAEPVQVFSQQSFFRSDCFFGSNLKPGDLVLGFVYSYEGNYSIPSGSLLKLSHYDHPVVKSIRKYIKNNQDPFSIEQDSLIYREFGFEHSLKQVLNCARHSQNNKN